MYRVVSSPRIQERITSALVALGRSLVIAAGLMALLLVPSLTHAADEPTIRATGGFSSRADFTNDAGNFRTSRWGVDAGWKGLYLEYDHTEYHWREYTRMRFSDGHKPWNELNFLRVGARLSGDLNENGLGWFWDGGLVMGWEDEMGSSFGLAGTGGLSYQFSSEFSGKVGVWGMAHPALLGIMPMARLDWNAPEEPGPSFSLGFPETMLRFRTEDGLTFRAGAKADMGERSHRLADDSHVYRKGYITTKGVTAGAYVDVSPVDGLTASFGLEYDIEREYEIRSSSGNRKQALDVENSPSLHFGVGYRF